MWCVHYWRRCHPNRPHQARLCLGRGPSGRWGQCLIWTWTSYFEECRWICWHSAEPRTPTSAVEGWESTFHGAAGHQRSLLGPQYELLFLPLEHIYLCSSILFYNKTPLILDVDNCSLFYITLNTCAAYGLQGPLKREILVRVMGPVMADSKGLQSISLCLTLKDDFEGWTTQVFQDDLWLASGKISFPDLFEATFVKKWVLRA